MTDRLGRFPLSRIGSSRRRLLTGLAGMGVLELAGACAGPAARVARRGVAKTGMAGGGHAPPPVPFGALPAPRQLAWHEMGAYAFMHFGINTFTDREWGYGDESPTLFNPTAFDPDQIAGAARAAGLKGLILTAKHHDGFCLWPTRLTEHCVRNSPYKGGKGDIVGEMAAACRRAGLKYGLYLSPWDRNHADYGRPGYLRYYRAALEELLTGYGPLFEMWFDGANGGDGYYGGARERRAIDAETYYDWRGTWALIRRHQPDTVIWGNWGHDAHGLWGADARWVGNEEGYAGDPCWPTVDAAPATQAIDEHGVRGGAYWRPAEVDVSIRPGWFWHAREDGEVKTPARLMRLYFESIGRGANLILNLPPNRTGRLSDPDVRSLRGWGDALARTFGHDLAAGAIARASDSRGTGFEAARVLDGGEGYWAAADAARAADLTLDWPAPVTFDVIRLREHIALGQRIGAFVLEVRDQGGGGWVEVARHTAIGNRRLVRLDRPRTTDGLRLRILDADASPTLREIAVFRLADLDEPPRISRDGQGLVRLDCDFPGAVLRYTTDGGLPTPASPRYEAPFPLPDGGTVRALAIRPDGRPTPDATRVFDLLPRGWRIVAASSPGAEVLIGDGGGAWSAPLDPVATVTVDLGRRLVPGAIILTPASPPPAGAGAPTAYTLEGSADGKAWRRLAGGELANIEANPSPQHIAVEHPFPLRYLRLTLPRGVGGPRGVEGASGVARVALARIGVRVAP